MRGAEVLGGLAGRAGVHPRACGEQSNTEKAGHGETGPSPRVRGAVAAGLGGHQVLGSIPARAGSSRHGGSGPFGDRVHPRACGEQSS